MSQNSSESQRQRLKRIARQAMVDRGLSPDFPPEAVAQLKSITGPARENDASIGDLRNLPWCSIDNDDSRDLDQLTVAQSGANGDTRILVAIADVDALVKKDTPIDKHAQQNTTSVYTPAQIFPMLPPELSTDYTSLNADEDREAIVIDMTVADDGTLRATDIYRALVRNQAKLAYNSVAAWLEDGAAPPEAMTRVAGLDENLRVQDRVAQKLNKLRHEQGALDFQTIEARPVFDGDALKDVEPEEKNHAKTLVEDFMIASNGITARYLESKQMPSIRRVVRSPKRWNRIVEVAAEHGATLPAEPDPVALEKFLVDARATDPTRFPDLSLSIIKLLGPGEYVVEHPGKDVGGHFGLAARDYTHSTAPNRRYPDVITQRLLKAALTGRPSPYAAEELDALALHCTQAEDAARKVERQVEKSAMAMLLESRIGEQFEGIVTGASDKGTYIRSLKPPVEGRIVRRFEGLKVGAKINVRLVRVDAEKGFIDFETAARES